MLAPERQDAILHVELTRVELVLVIAGRLRVLQVLADPRQVIVGEARIVQETSVLDDDGVPNIICC